MRTQWQALTKELSHACSLATLTFSGENIPVQVSNKIHMWVCLTDS